MARVQTRRDAADTPAASRFLSRRVAVASRRDVIEWRVASYALRRRDVCRVSRRVASLHVAVTTGASCSVERVR